MNSARHVIGRIFSPRFISDMASFDVASTIARHVIKRILNPRLLNYMASYDVASSVNQSLPPGGSATSGRRSTRQRRRQHRHRRRPWTDTGERTRTALCRSSGTRACHPAQALGQGADPPHSVLMLATSSTTCWTGTRHVTHLTVKPFSPGRPPTTQYTGSRHDILRMHSLIY
jgi:hypothetical protein